MSAAMDRYLDQIAVRIATLMETSSAQMEKASDAIIKAVRDDHVVYVFGTGHSHMLAEELHYRAGGPAYAVPVLAPELMLHEGAVASTRAERTEGRVRQVFSAYPITSGDVLIVISNSGVNAAPIEAVHLGKELGCTVIAITSIAYSTQAANGRGRIADIADIVIDNGIPAGDAVVSLPGTGLKAGPASTSVGAAIVNAVFVDVAYRLAKDGDPKIYRSANMPGAKENNERLVARYGRRNPHL